MAGISAVTNPREILWWRQGLFALFSGPPG
jgi:hypothetical protein